MDQHQARRPGGDGLTGPAADPPQAVDDVAADDDRGVAGVSPLGDDGTLDVAGDPPRGRARHHVAQTHGPTLPPRAALVRGTVADWSWAAWRLASGLVPVPPPESGGGSSSRGRGVDVVLLPGVYESWRFMAPLADALRAAGHRVHVVPVLGLHTVDVPLAAEVVREHVDARGLEGPLALVGHSKGGLVGKQLLAHHDDDGRFGCLVAVNAPFSGSARARWLPLRALRVFVPGGRLLRDLDAARSVNARITSISSVFDAHVPEGGRLEGATDVVVDVVGHFRTLGDARVHATVLDALDRCRGWSMGPPAGTPTA